MVLLAALAEHRRDVGGEIRSTDESLAFIIELGSYTLNRHHTGDLLAQTREALVKCRAL
ncbi:hypothetical protein HAX54_028239, partial [Datura stramonium]|nr:hypothetical protein [Datura stramonium]